MSVTLIYDFRATVGKADELLPILLGGRDFARTVDGCEAFDVYQGQEDSHHFVMTETWVSAEAQRDHFQANVIPSGSLEKVAALVTAPIEPRYFLKQ